MKAILDEIRSGKFAEEWIAESESGRANYKRAPGARARPTRSSRSASELRGMMPWISAGKTRVQDASGG